MEFLRKYNATTHVYVPIIKRGVVDFALSGDWTPAAGDVKIIKDGGAAANVTNLPTAIAMGNGAVWDFSLTATEMQAAKVVVTVVDAATKTIEDQCFAVTTFGNASAEYPPDFSDPNSLGLTRLDASVSSRASQTSLDAVDDYVDTEVAAIKAKTDNLPVDPADASDIAASFAAVNSALATIAAYVDTEVTAIKAKTDNLPVDPADASDIAASFAAVNSALATIAAYVDTEVAAIKAKTDNLPATPAAIADIPSASENAAAILAAIVEGSESLAELLRLMRAALLGKSDGFPSGPAHFRDRADTINRITATVDADGNRTAVSTDAS